jgi:NADPH:quinone reductase
MMRVAQFSEFAGPQALRLEEVAEPVPGPSDVLIKVTAVGLNFFDTLLLRNQYQVTPPLPFSPGAEVAGAIAGLGAGVTDFTIGQRVVAFIGGNGCREKVVTKAKNAVLIPDGVSDEIAAGIPVTYGTAIHAFKDRAQLKPGETVAVLGAAGGAGVAAIEIAKLMGARVIAVASSGDKLAFAREHGADEGVNYETEDLKARLKSLTLPKGVDVLYDTVGGAAAEPSLRAMAWEGRYLVLGFASGTIPKIPLNLLLLKGCAMIGVFWTSFVERSPEQHRANMIQLLDWCRRGQIHPHIHAIFALEETAKALSLIEARKVTGKVVVNPQL